jgi:hypothetical protein
MEKHTEDVCAGAVRYETTGRPKLAVSCYCRDASRFQAERLRMPLFASIRIGAAKPSARMLAAIC